MYQYIVLLKQLCIWICAIYKLSRGTTLFVNSIIRKSVSSRHWKALTPIWRLQNLKIGWKSSKSSVSLCEKALIGGIPQHLIDVIQVNVDVDYMDNAYIKSMPIVPHDQTSNPVFVDLALEHESSADLLGETVVELKDQDWVAIYTRMVIPGPKYQHQYQ